MILYVWLYQPLYFQNWYLLTQQCSSPGALISCQILYHLRGVRGQKYEMQENCVFNNCKCPAPCSSVMKAAPVGITWHGNGVIWLGRWSNMTKGTLFFLLRVILVLVAFSCIKLLWWSYIRCIALSWVFARYGDVVMLHFKEWCWIWWGASARIKEMIHCLSVKEIWHWPGIGIGKQNLAEDPATGLLFKYLFL